MSGSAGAGTLVILPTYNEYETLPSVISGIHQHVPDAHILVIDDGSPDGTGRLADSIAADASFVTVQHRSGKLGLGTAYIQGFRYALAQGYKFAVEMDSDGSHRPEDLTQLLAAGAAGAGLALGARWVPSGKIAGWPWYRRCISRTGTAVARVALRSKLHDLTSGFRVINTGWIARLDLASLNSQGYGFQVETAWMLELAGCPITEVPITFVERAGGHSKMSCAIVLEALAGVLRWGWKLRFPRQRG